MKLSEMRELLAAKGIQLTKSLGQNFLHDGNQLRRIVEAAELSGRDKVLEIGPGLGPLTELLVQRAGHVLAIEKDARLVLLLQDRIQAAGKGTLQLIHDDALEFLKREPTDWRDWKLVANLPYSVASPILVELARGENSPERLVITLQLEVARRLMARAGDEDYGVLTLLVGVDFDLAGWFRIPSGCFFPEPEVESGCLCLKRRPQPALAPELRAVFVRLVKRSFSQRRKMMFKLLRQDWPVEALSRAFEALQLPPTVRAEAVALEQFTMLSRLLGPAAA